MNILITGGTGLVGSALSKLLSEVGTIISPRRSECDILDEKSIRACMARHTPTLVIHSAAYVNAGVAESKRGDTSGLCYRTNVEAIKTVVEAARTVGSFVVYISTGSVFHGTEDNRGPFEIDDEPEKNPENNNWYGYTKYLGEMMGADAVVRISHPLVPPLLRIKDDYLQKVIRLYQKNELFPLYPDQYFPLTSVSDLAQSIIKIFERQERGVFHVASPDMVSPYELMKYALQQLNLPLDPLQILPIETFYVQGNSRLRFAKYSALASSKTRERLALRFRTWKQITNESLGIHELQPQEN